MSTYPINMLGEAVLSGDPPNVRGWTSSGIGIVVAMDVAKTHPPMSHLALDAGACPIIHPIGRCTQFPFSGPALTANLSPVVIASPGQTAWTANIALVAQLALLRSTM